jgi:group II intron reverse transcriptase/maturase
MNTPAALANLQTQLFRETQAAGLPAQQLLTWLLDRRNLEAAWERVRSTDGANTPGVDGMTCADIQRAHPWLTQLAGDLYQGRYQPAPPRWLDVPKHTGSSATRRLGILTIRDRVVHAALKQVLEPVLEPGFLSSSFGFRPGRSVPGALAEACRLLAAETRDAVPFPFAAHLDVADCFPTIDHQLLQEELARRIADEAVRRLIGQLLHAGGTTVRHWWRSRTVGLVQGSALSPLLCNLYLHPLDEALAQLGRATQNGVQMLRYADDLLLLARDARLARQGLACIQQTLARLRQRLRSTDAARPIQEGVTWLGLQLRPRPNRWTPKARFGYVVPDAKVVAMLERIKEMTAPPSERIDPTAFDLGRWIVSINDQLRDWHQAYVFADNAPEVFQALDEHTLDCVKELLHSVTGIRHHDLFRDYRVWLPRGFWSWQVNGSRLVVLSALAPRRPRNLIRKPPWQVPLAKAKDVAAEPAAGAAPRLFQMPNVAGAIQAAASAPNPAITSKPPPPANPAPAADKPPETGPGSEAGDSR